jgi:type IV secretion system protein VirB10
VEQQRRDAQSLYAANVAWSRTGRGTPPSPLAAPASSPSRNPDQAAAPTTTAQITSSTTDTADSSNTTTRTHRISEGTVLETVLTTRLDGSAAAPVNCLVTTPLYSRDGEHVLIPAGARLLGHTKPVQTLGETRLAVSFHRLVFPNGTSHPLNQFPGLNQRGDAGLRDVVNHHYLETFGAAAAVGLISGLSQLVASAGLDRDGDGQTIAITTGSADAGAQGVAQTMNRFLNRPPTITIREGHRVNVYLTSDLELPPYERLTTTSFVR